MGIGIDCGFIGLELSQLVIGDKLRQKLERYSRPAILGTLITSACMNAFAFGIEAQNWPMLAAAIALGVAIPALIYALTRVGAAIYIDYTVKY